MQRPPQMAHCHMRRPAIFEGQVIWNLNFGIWLIRGKRHEGENLLCGRCG